jgi:hypothetical protein
MHGHAAPGGKKGQEMTTSMLDTLIGARPSTADSAALRARAKLAVALCYHRSAPADAAIAVAVYAERIGAWHLGTPEGPAHWAARAEQAIGEIAEGVPPEVRALIPAFEPVPAPLEIARAATEILRGAPCPEWLERAYRDLAQLLPGQLRPKALGLPAAGGEP